MSTLCNVRPEKRAAVDLSKYQHTYESGRSWIIRACWFFVGAPLVRWQLMPWSGLRCRILRLFGAEIGSGVVIKPGVRIKFPWLLKAGDNTWIGEDCWIDNLAAVVLGDNVCLSQGVYLCTGNHDWDDPQFALLVRPIRILDGAWIGAKALVGPGTVIGEGAVVAMGGVALHGIPPYEIHGGNPAKLLGYRSRGVGMSAQHQTA